MNRRVGRLLDGFAAFRRTRPFWGALLLVAAGADVIYFAGYPIFFAVSGGWNSSAAYILGGGLILFGLVAAMAPIHSPLLGVLGVLVALAAFVAANLGGMLLGTLLGIVGGSMVFAWGEKKPGKRQSTPDASTPAPAAEVVGR
ncbi:DUF6114 domain-containing protein [Flexivirga meconopsidis]|uniref:DUF6114 domain-containing protein n=1 Tax=Flexivirga meconopsidis TaxID=2977121 RepID=UPI002240B0A9|nr:DUF6114 domain-containing protein [Flexivirga meconopsidis]